jgi:hypothetical protein
MKIMLEHNGTRREFLRSVTRGGLLGGMAFLGVLLTRGRGNRDAARHRCVGGGFCRECGAFSGCMLPAALSAKRAADRSGETSF